MRIQVRRSQKQLIAQNIDMRRLVAILILCASVTAIMAGLLPIMWSHGTGAEVMQRIAVPSWQLGTGREVSKPNLKLNRLRRPHRGPPSRRFRLKNRPGN